MGVDLPEGPANLSFEQAAVVPTSRQPLCRLFAKNRDGKGAVRGVTVYNPQQMLGGVITWVEIAEIFRPRAQLGLF